MNPYTLGNWTVSSLYQDTVAVKRGTYVTELDFGKDFAKASDDSTEASIKNVTAEGVTSPESIRFGSTPVKNIYAGTSVELASQLPSKAGVQALIEISETYRAVNSVSGQEIDIPCKARLVLRVPTSQPVKSAIVSDLIQRVFGACYSPGEHAYDDLDRLNDVLKGALLPEGV